MSTLYASFSYPRDAENAAGALLDQGARVEDVSILTHESYGSARSIPVEHLTPPALTTTTGTDALMGAVKGGTVGVGIGIIAALTALTIPGLGIVIGAGAVATAFGGAAATVAAGAVAGGVMGFLKDQGFSEDQIAHYSNAVTSGGAILSLNVPSGSLPEDQSEGILLKYGATNVSTAKPIDATSAIPGGAVSRVSIIEGQRAVGTVDPVTGLLEPEGSLANVEPTEIDPVTGQIVEGFILDPTTGVKRLVRVEQGKLIYMS